MSGLALITVSNAEEMQLFLDLPHRVHCKHPLWVPPLKSQEQDLLTPGRHPFGNEAECSLFLAVRDSVPVGRIAAVADRKADARASEKIGAWGFFECMDDREAAHSLFAAARNFHTARGAAFLRGPLNPSTNYTCAMLVDGFDKAPAVMMPWNPPWYPLFAEAWGMRKEQDLLAYRFELDAVLRSAPARKELALVKQRGEFFARVSSKATLERDIALMLDIYGESWADNWGFCPISEAEARQHVKDLRGVLDPGLFTLFYHKDAPDTPGGGMLALPDITPLLRALKGSLGLSAPWHWLRTRAEAAKSCRLLLFGVKPRYRLMGLPLLVLDFMLECARKRPQLQWVEASWSLEDNEAINDLIEDFGGSLEKRYRIYRRETGDA